MKFPSLFLMNMCMLNLSMLMRVVVAKPPFIGLSSFKISSIAAQTSSDRETIVTTNPASSSRLRDSRIRKRLESLVLLRGGENKKPTKKAGSLKDIKKDDDKKDGASSSSDKVGDGEEDEEDDFDIENDNSGQQSQALSSITDMWTKTPPITQLYVGKFFLKHWPPLLPIHILFIFLHG
jgi:hypothetical protein